MSLHGKKFNASLLRLEIRQGCPLTLLFNMGLQVLVGALRQEKGLKIIQIEKKEIKLFLLRDDFMVYLENSRNLYINS